MRRFESVGRFESCGNIAARQGAGRRAKYIALELVRAMFQLAQVLLLSSQISGEGERVRGTAISVISVAVTTMSTRIILSGGVVFITLLE